LANVSEERAIAGSYRQINEGRKPDARFAQQWLRGLMVGYWLGFSWEDLFNALGMYPDI
jgi:hypothetical protein